MILKKKSLKKVAKNVTVANTMGKRTRRVRGRRKRMSQMEKQQAKINERRQLERELSSNWGKLQNAAGTVVSKRKEKIKARIRKREERMRIENINRVVGKSIKRESEKLREKIIKSYHVYGNCIINVNLHDNLPKNQPKYGYVNQRMMVRLKYEVRIWCAILMNLT